MADQLTLVEKKAKQRQKRLRASKNKQQLSRRKLLPEPPMNFFLTSNEEKSKCLPGRRPRKKQKSEYGSSIFSSNYKILQEIGSGEFGTVYKLVSRLDGCIYAVKELKKMSNPLKRRSREMLCILYVGYQIARIM